MDYESSFTVDNELILIADNLSKILLKNKLTISVAESCTGGLIGAVITSLSGSSAYFKGGIIAYDNDVKSSVLDISSKLIQEKGAVSVEVSSAMAQGVANLLKTDCAISVSGIAGPGGGTEEKPVGTVCIGIYLNSKTTSFVENFSGDRNNIRLETTITAIKVLTDKISDAYV